MATRDRWAELVGAYQPAIVPSLAEQEAESETLDLPGAAGATTDLRAESGTVGASVTAPTPSQVDVQSGDSQQVPTGPDIKTGDSAKHEHYWIHTVTETIERGNAEFVSFSIPIAAGATHQLFGLNDLRTRAEIVIIDAGAQATGKKVYFGDRDIIEGADASLAFAIGARGLHEYRSRKEAWIANLEDSALVVTVIEYTSEKGQDVLGHVKRSGK
jgi:hypothetical protein